MQNNTIQIVTVDYTDDAQCVAIPILLNVYAKDLLGVCKTLDEAVL